MLFQASHVSNSNLLDDMHGSYQESYDTNEDDFIKQFEKVPPMSSDGMEMALKDSEVLIDEECEVLEQEGEYKMSLMRKKRPMVFESTKPDSAVLDKALHSPLN